MRLWCRGRNVVTHTAYSEIWPLPAFNPSLRSSACSTRGAVLGPVSCSRTLEHSDCSTTWGTATHSFYSDGQKNPSILVLSNQRIFFPLISEFPTCLRVNDGGELFSLPGPQSIFFFWCLLARSLGLWGPPAPGGFPRVNSNSNLTIPRYSHLDIERPFINKNTNRAPRWFLFTADLKIIKSSDVFFIHYVYLYCKNICINSNHDYV